MCGIMGVISSKNRIDQDLLKKSITLMNNRGPDSNGLWIKDNVGLAHCRLSIIDLSNSAKQPMITKDFKYVICFNGEIYNYKELKNQLSYHWKTNSDTEVIIAAYIKWGKDCLIHLKGMFAFAIWDTDKKELFIARDRLGVKPLYYYFSEKEFIFSSRPKSIISMLSANDYNLDLQATRLFFECGYIPAPHSIYDSIKKLPPAHYLILNESGISCNRYWDFRNIKTEERWEKRNEDDLLDELDGIISNSVKLRMISDVPLGAFLSGGIDSSVVVAMMRKYSDRPIKTFTIGFQEKNYDESKYAQDISSFLQTEHHSEIMNIDNLLGFFPKFWEEFDEPFFDYSCFPTMAVSKLARKHVTVALSGDGGDELFGGYHYYQIINNSKYFFKLPRYLRNIISYNIQMIPSHQFKLLAHYFKSRDLISGFAFMRSINKDNDVLESRFFANTYGISELFSKCNLELNSSVSDVEKTMRLDLFHTLPDDYMQKVDLSTMAFSLEAREPLLDHELVEWAMKLPTKWKLNKNTNKYLLRKLAYRYIPQSMLDRPKQGFGVPIENWLRGSLKELTDEAINSNKNELFNQKNLSKIWNLHLSKSRNFHPLIWSFLIFNEFCKRNKL